MNKRVKYDTGKEVVECLLVDIGGRHGTIELPDGYFKQVPMHFLKAIQESTGITKIEDKRSMEAGLLRFTINGKKVYKLRYELLASVQVQINKVLSGQMTIEEFNQMELL